MSTLPAYFQNPIPYTMVQMMDQGSKP